MNDCVWSKRRIRYVKDNRESWRISSSHILSDYFDVETFSWKNKLFFMNSVKSKAFRLDGGCLRNFYMQMLGSKEECSKYKVSISLEDEAGLFKISYTDQPFMIER